MSVSLFDHEQRLRDLEVGLTAVLAVLAAEQPAVRHAVDAAAQRLRAKGETGAAGLLLNAAARAYAR